MKLTDPVNHCLVVELKDVRPHPNADRLQIADAAGNIVIVGLEAKEGQTVLLFDSNLQLSPAYLKANNLYSNNAMNADQTKRGYFGQNGRVKAQKLRGTLSTGFAAEVDTVAFSGFPTASLKVGDAFNSLNGVEICSRYEQPEEQAGNTGASQTRRKIKAFPRHWQTQHLARNLDSIGQDREVWIEEKLHGTSGRLAKLKVERELSWLEKLAKKVSIRVEEEEWQVVYGSRRVDMKLDGAEQANPSYKGNMRVNIAKKLGPLLRHGEQLYFEIVGFETNGSEVQKGFHYGCAKGEFDVYLYRVSINQPDQCYDLNRRQVRHRATELGIKAAPLLGMCKGSDAYEVATQRRDGKSKVDGKTMREGVVCWFEDKSGNWTCLKHKSPAFLEKEQANGN